MGLLNFLKKFNTSEQPIPNSEKKYYQPDSYYTNKAHQGTQFERDVITFEERKNTSIPSKNGLYVAEILLLEYCSYGTYPHPKDGYPGFWWFEYGIRNVDARLKSLEERGFIRISSPSESISSLTTTQLKEILKSCGLPINGKKNDLVQRIRNNLSNDDLSDYISECKYILTDLGKSELSENEYIPYLHKKKALGITVWQINSRISKEVNWQKHFRDMLWREFSTQCQQHIKEQNYGFYRNTRFEMAMFLKEEQKYYDAIALLSEVAFWDLTGCGNNFNYNSFLEVEFGLNKQLGNGFLFPYEKSIMTIAPGIIREMGICQKKLNLSDDDLKVFLAESVKKLTSPVQFFTYDEIVDIIFWERDKNVSQLNKVYDKAKKRFDPQNPNILSTQK